MKLNVRRTALVGLGFLAISAFWQLYDFTVPLILKDTYALGDTASGLVMTMDNIAALVLLPLFGSLSDRCRMKMGRRMPFLLFGSMGAAALALLLPLVVNTSPLYVFLILLALTLIVMGVFRSPTVALMPDVTPRPLRSRANAIINLMGAIGAASMLLLTNFLIVQRADGSSDYTWLYVSVAAVLVICAWTVKLTIPERELAAQAEAACPTEDPPAQPDAPARRLSRDERRSLVLLLCSVALWFMGYNAVTTAFSKYAMQVWQVPEGTAANCILIGTAGAIISYWPVGQLSARFGRQTMILMGLLALMVCFLVGTAMQEMSVVAYVMFALVGLGWASIGVNSYPMVVELASGADVGRYTGYYYTFSMAAQVLTPVLSGALLEHAGYWTLFPYALAMIAAAFVTMSFVRHGDSRPEARSGLEALDVD